MSLVHEALQKAEREKQSKTGGSHVIQVLPKPTPSVVAVASVDLSAAASAKADNHGPRSPALAEGASSGPSAATMVLPQKSHQTMLTGLIAVVATVAMVAIVYLVGVATTTIRESKQAVNTAPTAPVSTPTDAARDNSGRKPQAIAPSVRANQRAAAESSQPTDAAGPDARFKLSGIMKTPDGPYAAVVNGRVVYEGHYVDGATVRKIERDRITLELAGREQVLRLF